MLSAPSFVGQRTLSHLGVLAATALTAFVAVTFLLTTWLLAPAVAESAFRDSVAIASDDQRAITISSQFPLESNREAGDNVRRALDRHNDIVGSVSSETWSSAFTTPSLRDRARIDVGTRSDVTETAELAAGRWHASGKDPIEATAGAEVLNAMDASVGDTVALVPLVGDNEPLRVSIVGSFRQSGPTPESIEFEAGASLAGDGAISSAGELVVDLADVADALEPAATRTTTTIELDLDQVSLADASATAQSITDLTSTLAEAAEAGTSGYASRAVVRQPDGLMESAQAAAVAARSVVLVLASLLALLAIWALWLTARLLAARKSGVTALLRARGATRPRLLGMSVAANTIPAAIIAVSSPPAAMAIFSVLRDQGGVTGATSSPAGLWALSTAVVLCWLALAAVTELRAGTSMAAQLTESGRPRRTTAVQRAGVDVVVLVLGVVAVLQLRRPPAETHELVVVLAPSVLVLAGALLAIRVLPWVGRAAEAVAAKLTGPAAVLGTCEVGRRTPRHASAALLVMFAVAVVVATASLQTTFTSARNGADDLVEPADMRIRAVTGIDDTNAATPTQQELEDLPGVDVVMPVVRTSTSLRGGTLDIVGIDPALAPEVIGWPERFAGLQVDRLGQLLEPEADDWPVLVTRSYADQHAYDIGDSIELTVAGRAMSVGVADIVVAVPGSASEFAILADLRLLGVGRSAPSEWWIATSRPDIVSDAAAQLTTVEVIPPRGAASIDTGAGAVVLSALTAGVLLAALTLLLGVSVQAAATARARGGEHAILVAMGMTPAATVAAVAMEQSLVLVIAAVMGVGIGAVVAWLTVPGVVEPLVAGPDWLPVSTTHSPLVMMAIGVGVAALIAVVAAGMATAFRRVDVPAALRAGERG